jgi:histidine triad (HIT) family protein
MENCLFCGIASGDIPADIVYQDDDVVAFRDIHPVAPVHVLVIPRKHLAHFGEFAEEDEVLMGRIVRTAARVATEEGVAGSGYRSVINSGEDANQTVRHLHLHVIGGRRMGWPPG